MAAYGVEPLKLAQVSQKYDHWTEERLGNSNETTWVQSSPIAAYGVEPLKLAQLS